MSEIKVPIVKAGHYCAVWHCKNNSKNSNESFFSFPKDLERAMVWAQNCGRIDLLKIPQKLYQSYRVCSAHFETTMFLNDLRNRLQPYAVPVSFTEQKDIPQTSPSESSCTNAILLCTEIEIPQTLPSTEALLPSTKIQEVSDFPCIKRKYKDITMITETATPVKMPKLHSDNQGPTIMTDISTQTPKNWTGSISKKSKLWTRLHDLQIENAHLKKDIMLLENQLEDNPANISLEHYKQATYKFCPSKDLAQFINVQVTQGQKNPNQHCYTNRFNQLCFFCGFYGNTV